MSSRIRFCIALALLLALGACSRSDDLPLSPDLSGDAAALSSQSMNPALQMSSPSGVQMDLLPHHENNVVNRSRFGRIRAALVGTATFDVRDVDLSSLRLESVRPRRTRFGDSTGPIGGTGELVSVLRINAGGPELPGAPVWMDDAAFTTSTYSNTGFAGVTTEAIDLSDASVPAGTPMSLFQSERYDGAALPDMLWEIPVENGSYAVRLYFADNYPPAHQIGARLFDISVEGQVAFQDYDIFARVGGFAGVVEEIATEVSDGSASISFGRVNQNPTVCGIELLARSAGSAGPRVEDGIEDLNMTFSKRRLMRAIGPVAPGATVELTLTGALRDGTPFEAVDSITFRSRRHGGGHDDDR